MPHLMASRQFYPEDGADRSVVYASTTLTVVKKEYAQLEKEGLAIIYDTKKFLYGGPFTNLYHSYLVRVNKYPRWPHQEYNSGLSP